MLKFPKICCIDTCKCQFRYARYVLNFHTTRDYFIYIYISHAYTHISIGTYEGKDTKNKDLVHVRNWEAFPNGAHILDQFKGVMVNGIFVDNYHLYFNFKNAMSWHVYIV